MAAQDISAELAGDISEATGGGGKPFIRHGKYYEFLITRCHSKKVKMDDTKWHRFAFMEFKVLKSVPHDKGVIPTSKHSKDDGSTPNAEGSVCSNSIDFDGGGAAMAPQNVREFICGFFGMNTDELSKDDGFKTWIDLCRKEDVKAGGIDYIDPKTNQPVIATKDKVANMGCGYVIALETSSKELKETRKVKDMAQEERKYFTNKNWICLARPGTGVNSPELVTKRRAEILLNMPPEIEEDEGDENMADAGAAAQAAAAQAQAVAQAAAQAAAGGSPTPPVAPTPVAPTAPTPPVVADPNWPPKAPWEGPSPATAQWLVAGFVWSNPANGGNNEVIKESDYRAGKRSK